MQGEKHGARRKLAIVSLLGGCVLLVVKSFLLPALPAEASQNATPDSTGGYTATAVEYRGGHPVFYTARDMSAQSARSAVVAAHAGSEFLGWQTPARIESTDTLRSGQTNLDVLKLDQLTERPNVSGVTVAVVDSGVWASHEDFAPGTVLPGFDFVNDGLSSDGRQDPNGHGTHVAGIIAAATNNGLGIEGVASGVHILPVRVLDASGNGDSTRISNGIIAAVDAGAGVINVSTGGAYSASYQVAVDYAANHGVPVVAAAGNDGAGSNAPDYPAAVATAISVAATDNDGKHAAFSTFNPSVDVAAPGVGIDSFGQYLGSSTYLYKSGTSQSAAEVSGVVALLRAKNPSMTVAQMSSRLAATAVDVGTPGPDNETGAGVVNPLALLATVPDAPTLNAVAPVDGGTLVSFATPHDNGAVVLSYTVHATPEHGPTIDRPVDAGATRPVLITGLAAGRPYQVTVTALNGVGSSPASAAMSVTPLGTQIHSAHGAWTVGGDGGVFSFGNAAFHGSTGGLKLNKPVVGMAGTPSGNGYWFVASDGGVFSFGDAGFYGSTGDVKLNKPVVGMASTPSGRGYWLVASDGGIFAFGDAGFYGSTGSVALNQPIVSMTPTASGNGYWFVARDGGIFAYGDAAFHGSLGGQSTAAPTTSMTATADGSGYWLLLGNGEVRAFGAAGAHGNAAAGAVGIASDGSDGYVITDADGAIAGYGSLAATVTPHGAMRLNKPVQGVAISLT